MGTRERWAHREGTDLIEQLRQQGGMGRAKERRQLRPACFQQNLPHTLPMIVRSDRLDSGLVHAGATARGTNSVSLRRDSDTAHALDSRPGFRDTYPGIARVQLRLARLADAPVKKPRTLPCRSRQEMTPSEFRAGQC
jgi:hypothetical protein